jgi:hypothetical protein
MKRLFLYSLIIISIWVVAFGGIYILNGQHEHKILYGYGVMFSILLTIIMLLIRRK